MSSTSAPILRSWTPLVVLGVLMSALIWPPILFGRQAVSEADDQNKNHLPVIRKMADEWPRVDLVNYNSATAPGYHLFLALVCRYVTPNETALRMLSSMFGIGLCVCVLAFAAMRINGWKALAYAAPLCCSSYVLSGAMWLTTDNAAWMFVALSLGLAVMLPITPGKVLGSSVLTALAVFVRQIHIWLIAPIGLAGLLRLREPSANKSAMMASLLSLALPAVLLLALVLTWRGLVPPGSEDITKMHGRGMNPAAIPLTLALFGVFGVFFTCSFGPISFRELLSDRRTWFIAACAMVISVAVPTSFSYDHGRWGGAIWEVIKRAPAVKDRSILLPPLAVFGSLVLYHGWRRATVAGNSRHASLLMFAVVCWLAAQSMNSQAWQRYLEPMILMTLPWLASLATSRSNEAPASRWREWIGPAIFAGILLALSIKTVYLPVITGHTPT